MCITGSEEDVDDEVANAAQATLSLDSRSGDNFGGRHVYFHGLREVPEAWGAGS